MNSHSSLPTEPSRGKVAAAGLLAGGIAGLVMTTVMLLLAWLFGVATPLAIMGDRLSVFIPVDTFLALMGRVGGYNNMKMLGVGSVILGQVGVGALGGMGYVLFMRGRESSRFASIAVFILLPLVAVTLLLWPVLGTHYGGFPIGKATVVTLAGLVAAFLCFERTLVPGLHFMTRQRTAEGDEEFSPSMGRRALLFGGLGLVVAGGGAALLCKLFRAATFSYDGMQYKGREVEPITPNDKFYCVTKNVVDPKVDASKWRLEITGLVQTRQTHKLEWLKAQAAVTQETTMMCISNGLGAGLMSNAVWKGVPLRTLLAGASPLPGAVKVKLHGVDNYTDTIPLAKALEPTTLVAYEMNGEPLPDRHGFPARVLVPGYFGEKAVKWVTRIEVTDAEAKGFYEEQGWGPDFIVPIRARIDQPDHDAWFAPGVLTGPVPVKGIAFGGDRGVSRVEVSFDDGNTWADARLDYPGTPLTWVLWSYEWRPAGPASYTLVVRATNGDGKVQALDEARPFKSGTTGFHKILVHVA